MQRSPPLFSSIGLIFTFLLVAGLGIAVWLSGGMAFSPGALSSGSRAHRAKVEFLSHAEFEAECNHCHAPFETTQDVLCQECHLDVAEQVSGGRGTHGSIERSNRCADCHPDHRGRDFDMIAAALPLFAHDRTAFSLVGHQVGYDAVPLTCDDCHHLDGPFTVAVEECAYCHAADDRSFMRQHRQDFGDACLDCHDGTDRMVGLNHTTTGFPLDGQHEKLTCAACHFTRSTASNVSVQGQVQPAARTSQIFQNTPAACSGCHAEPEKHQGLFGPDCAVCHTPLGWRPAEWNGSPFSHEAEGRFSLVLHLQDFAGQPLLCTGCHREIGNPFDQQICTDCHAQNPQAPNFMIEHLEQFGPSCLDCHDGVDRLSDFDHTRFFPLDGAHMDLGCEVCHQEKVFRGAPSDCVECHAEPEIHLGFFGTRCEYCHATQSWSPAALRMHRFPLDHGGQGEVACETCHVETYVEYTCYGCHDHQPDAIRESHQEAGIMPEELPNCAVCHSNGLEAEQTPGD